MIERRSLDLVGALDARDRRLDLQPRDEAVKFVPPFDNERQRCALGMR